MIKSNYTTALAAGLVSVLSIGAVLPSGAQHGPRDYQRTALTAIKEGKWQEALDAVDRCIRVYEPRIKMLGLDDGFGPGSSQPFMRASEPAAALALARMDTSLP